MNSTDVQTPSRVRGREAKGARGAYVRDGAVAARPQNLARVAAQLSRLTRLERHTVLGCEAGGWGV
jgi:hypothetical protein